jgi:hypothetical protein
VKRLSGRGQIAQRSARIGQRHPVRLAVADLRFHQPIENIDRLARLAGFDHRGGLRDQHADAGAVRGKQPVQRGQRFMVGAAGDGALAVHRLDRRLALIAAEHARARSDAEFVFGFDDQLTTPQPGALPFQRNEGTARATSRGAARFAIQHQGQETARFGLGWQQGHQQPAEEQRFFGQVVHAGIGTGHGIPAGAEGRRTRSRVN